jgi:hypothetical protein
MSLSGVLCLLGKTTHPPALGASRGAGGAWTSGVSLLAVVVALALTGADRFRTSPLLYAVHDVHYDTS